MTIKFRVRNALTNEIIGYEFIGENGWWYYQAVGSDTQTNGTIPNFTDFIREQYIGITDKNGVEIYFNDILKVTHPNAPNCPGSTILGKVEYDAVNSRFEFSEYNEGSGWQWDIIPVYEDLTLEVLGDAYRFEQDPEYFLCALEAEAA